MLFNLDLQPLLAFTDGDVWRPGIGDPTVMGWVTVVAYFVAAGLCGRVAVRHRRERHREWPLWAGAALFLVLLGINKQLDLQTWFTLTFRNLAVQQGWYENRRLLQTSFIIGLTLVSAIGLTVIYLRYKELFKKQWMLCAGVLFTVAFVLIRASSFHQVDQLLGMRFAGLKMNWVLELGGIFFLIFAALRAQREAQRPN